MSSEHTIADLIDALPILVPPPGFAERVVALAAAERDAIAEARRVLDAVETRRPPEGFADHVIELFARSRARPEVLPPPASALPAAWFDVSGVVERPREPPAPEDVPGDPPGSAPEMQAGDVVAGKYRLLRRVSEGPMSVVWAARNEHTYREVALKLVARSTPDRRDRVMREVIACGAIEHRNLPRIYDVTASGSGDPVVVLQWLPGETLGELLMRRSRLHRIEVSSIAASVAGALSALHARGIVHLDVKPDNVLLHRDVEGEREVVKLLGFGESRWAGEATASRGGWGTSVYTSPEQVRGDRVDHRADLWGLGVLLVEMLVGEPPFFGKVGVGTRQVNAEDPPLLANIARDLDEDLLRIASECLHQDREERPPSMADVAAWLIEIARASTLQPRALSLARRDWPPPPPALERHVWQSPPGAGTRTLFGTVRIYVEADVASTPGRRDVAASATPSYEAGASLVPFHPVSDVGGHDLSTPRSAPHAARPARLMGAAAILFTAVVLVLSWVSGLFAGPMSPVGPAATTEPRGLPPSTSSTADAARGAPSSARGDQPSSSSQTAFTRSP